jgi:hypothetical protein
LPWLSPTLTIGQCLEIVTLFLLPMTMLRLGLRGTMILGLGAWTLGLSVLTAGWPTWLVVGSLGLHGLCISCFIVAGQVFVNSQASSDIRASAQGLLGFLTGGGLLVGNLLVGLVRRQTDGDFTPAFAVGAVIASALAVAFAIGFPGEESDELAADVQPTVASATPRG